MAQFIGPNIKYTGGTHHTYTSESIDYGVWTFSAGSGSLTTKTPITCDILVVAGGGGGGGSDNGDGGSGGSGIVMIRYKAS
jgi:hypothetical protein